MDLILLLRKEKKRTALCVRAKCDTIVLCWKHKKKIKDFTLGDKEEIMLNKNHKDKTQQG